MASNKEKLEELYKKYKNCTKCDLGNSGRKNIVFGDGNPNAKIMFIGEGPGKDEDLQAKPFVGRSGKLLRSTIKSVQIDSNDIYITNIVKCRPPNNRVPSPTETKMCKSILLFMQIKIIKPRLICTLGASALNTIICAGNQKHKISKIHGKVFIKNETRFIPLFHPAYILRNQTKLPIFKLDLETVKAELKKIS